VLTLSNPATIFAFIAVFGTLGARMAGGSPWTMIAGVLAGSALWWLLLCAAVARLRSRFDARVQAAVNRVSALLLAGFALWQWAGLLGT
jgi:arginine exporter protein ArgO